MRANQPAMSTGAPGAPRARDGRRRFTLIELLVVIAIIAVLVSMLLPALGGARERGRRAVCLNNLRQIHVAAMVYADDFNEWLPEPAVWPVGQPYDSITNTWGNSSNALNIAWPSHAGTAGLHTGWWNLLDDSGFHYLSRAAARCPSMAAMNWHNPGSWNPGGYMVDYDYRYNNEMTAYFHPDKKKWYSRRTLAFDYYPALPLFHEGTAYRRDPATLYRSVHTKTTSGQWALQWPHLTGGHVLTHAGDAFWLNNLYDTTSSWDFYSHGKGWPSGGVYTFYDYWGIGLDKYCRERR